MSESISRFTAIAAGLLALSLLSGGALAEDASTPAPHWSGLPIWGAEAEARGYQVPLPFGIGVTAYSARQPVNIQDLQLGRNGKDPVSVKNFLQIDKVDTSQQNISAKLDLLVFPFLDVYALLGYTKGTTKGQIQVPGEPVLGIIEPRTLQLNAAFNGPTYGAGFTLQGGGKISDWRDLTAIVVADWNRTQTKLSFENETLIADTKPIATVFSARVGLHGSVGPSMGAAIWTGAMHQQHPANGRRQRCQYRPSIRRDPIADATVEHAARRPDRVRQGWLCSGRGRARRSQVDPRGSCVPVLIGLRRRRMRSA